MKKVSSTMNMTGFASRDTGFSLTNESRSVLVDVRLLRKRDEVGLVPFEVILSVPVYAFLDEFENRSECGVGEERENNEQEYNDIDKYIQLDTVSMTTSLSVSRMLLHRDI